MSDIKDHKLGLALEAFCRRHIEGNQFSPSGADWDALSLDAKNYIRDTYLGPMHAAAQALDEAICDAVRADFERELATEGATRDDTMAVRGWLKTHGLWTGPDSMRAPL